MEPILCEIRVDPPQTPSIDQQQLMIVGAIFARELKPPGRKRLEKLKTAFSVSDFHRCCCEGSRQHWPIPALALIVVSTYHAFVETAPHNIWLDFETISRKAAIRGQYDGMTNTDVKGQPAVVSVKS